MFELWDNYLIIPYEAWHEGYFKAILESVCKFNSDISLPTLIIIIITTMKSVEITIVELINMIVFSSWSSSMKVA